jgi:hypothetical protein
MTLQSLEEDRKDTVGNFTTDNAVSLNDATLPQNVDEMETNDSITVHESLREGEGPLYNCLHFLDVFRNYCA